MNGIHGKVILYFVGRQWSRFILPTLYILLVLDHTRAFELNKIALHNSLPTTTGCVARPLLYHASVTTLYTNNVALQDLLTE